MLCGGPPATTPNPPEVHSLQQPRQIGHHRSTTFWRLTGRNGSRRFQGVCELDVPPSQSSTSIKLGSPACRRLPVSGCLLGVAIELSPLSNLARVSSFLLSSARTSCPYAGSAFGIFEAPHRAVNPARSPTMIRPPFQRINLDGLHSAIGCAERT